MASQVLRGQNAAEQEYTVVLIFVNSSKISRWENRIHGPMMNSRPSTRSPIRYSGTVVSKDRQGIYGLSYKDQLRQWKSSDIAAANINPYFYTLPLVQQLTQDLSVQIFKHRKNHQKMIDQRTMVSNQNDRTAVGKSLLNSTGILNSQLNDLAIFTQDLKKVSSADDENNLAKYRDILSYCEEVLNDGNEAVQMTRDYMQSEIGLWSIAESQRSIEEAVSVKRLTQLAFIFLPLSFVTSLYGMNVQEISGNGIRLWIFFVTAICVTMCSIFTWRIIEPVKNLWVKYTLYEAVVILCI